MLNEGIVGCNSRSTNMFIFVDLVTEGEIENESVEERNIFCGQALEKKANSAKIAKRDSL